MEEFLKANLWVEQKNGSWWRQSTSEYLTAETVKLLKKMVDK